MRHTVLNGSEDTFPKQEEKDVHLHDNNRSYIVITQDEQGAMRWETFVYSQ